MKRSNRHHHSQLMGGNSNPLAGPQQGLDPVVSCIGDVVSVSIDVPIIKRISLVPIEAPDQAFPGDFQEQELENDPSIVINGAAK